jgi:hypothetical protein
MSETCLKKTNKKLKNLGINIREKLSAEYII